MSSMLELIRKQKAERAKTGERSDAQKVQISDIALRGSGLTKREAAKDSREYARQTAKSLKADKSEFIENADSQFASAIEQTIAAMQADNKKSDIVFDDSQIRAIAGIMHNKVSVLIGAAGTGKTTVTKEITRRLAEKSGKIHASATNFIYVTINDKQIRMLEREAIKKGLLPEPKDDEQISVAFAAYTGRATQQLKRALPEIWHKNASTMHSLLGYAPVFEEVEKYDKITGNAYIDTVRKFRPSFGLDLKLPYSTYVLDEASMIPIPLFNELIDAIHETSRILLIGDIHQLPPVYGKSVLGYAMRKWPVFELTTIHRQAAGNAIISNAHNTLKGKPLENADNFHLIGNRGKTTSPPGGAELQTYFLSVIQKLHDMKRYDPYRDAIIVPQNKGPVGVTELNAHLVTMFNPEMKENGIIVNKRINIHTGTGHVFFAIRDKVMITSNINTVDPPITNGMIGIVESININGRYDMKRSQVDFDADSSEDDEIELDLDNLNFALDAGTGKLNEKDEETNDETDDQRQSSHVLTIKFENGQTFTASTAGDYRRITHGYAATCHKSQGGEYPNIIVLCHSVNAVMLTQEWLYTAITRARNNVYIVCNERGINQALKRQVIKGYSLKEKIHSYIIETKSDEDGFDKSKFPILWAPKEIT